MELLLIFKLGENEWKLRNRKLFQEVTVFIPDKKKTLIKHPSNQITKAHNKVNPNLTTFKMNTEILKLNTYKLNYNSI